MKTNTKEVKWANKRAVKAKENALNNSYVELLNDPQLAGKKIYSIAER